jgi:hypothetical protein
VNALNFVSGHVIFSFCAPIAVVEAWRPQSAREPWLGRGAVIISTGLYILAATLIVLDPESHSASIWQIVGSLAVACLCVVAAVGLGRRSRRPSPAGHNPRVLTVAGTTFVLLVVATSVPETWAGAAVTATALVIGTVWLVRAARGGQWSVRHAAAVAIGALLSRGALAFFYYPFVGQVSAGRKYTHNVVMLALVVFAGWLALREHDSTAPGSGDGVQREVFSD